MKINNIVGFFDLGKSFQIDIAFDILSLVEKEEEIFILKIKNEIRIKNSNLRSKSNMSHKDAFNNSLQINFIDNISFKFFKNGKIHVSGFKSNEQAYKKLYFILDLLTEYVPKKPVKIKVFENSNGILFYTTKNGTTFIIGKEENENENIYVHKVRIFMQKQIYSTGRKKDKEIQLELCQRDDCIQVEYNHEKNLFYSSTHIKERFIYNNHLNFIGKCQLQFISPYRRNLPGFDKFYISNDKLYYTNTNKDNLPFAILSETFFKNPIQSHSQEKFLMYPTFEYDRKNIKFEINLINIKENIGQKGNIDKILFYNCLLKYPEIEVKYNPNNYSGICFEYLSLKIKGQIHGNNVNLSCKNISDATIVINFLKKLYSDNFDFFTQKSQKAQDLNLTIFDLLKKC